MPDGSSLPEIKISQLPVGSTANLTDQLEANQAGVSRSITVGQVATTVAGTLPATLPPSGAAAGDLAGSYPGPTIKPSVALTGVPLATTPTPGDNTTKIATTAFVTTAVAAAVGGSTPTGPAGGDLAGTYPNPTVKAGVGLTGAPTSTTPATADNTTKIATTAYVQAQGYATTASIPTTLPPSGLAGGALTGSYPNPTLVGGPLSNYALTSSIPAALPPNGAAGGMLSGTYPNPGIAPSGTNGQVLTTVSGAAAWAAPPAAVTIVRTTVFTAGGTWTPNANLVYAEVQGWGAGGAGGSCTAAPANTFISGGGGAAGSWAKKFLTKAQAGASQTVTIGAAAAQPASGNVAGGNGGDTSLGVLLIAKGGSGGAACNGTTTFGVGGLGTSGGTGDQVGIGMSGGTSTFSNLQLSSSASGGAASPMGSGGRGNSGAAASNGEAAIGFASGGAGGGSYNAGAAGRGGVGTGGYLAIQEYCTV